MHQATRRVLATLVSCTALLGAVAAQAHEKRGDPPTAPRADGAPTPVASRHVVMRGPFRSVQVNIDSEGNNIPRDAANEPSLAIDPVDPSRMLIGWRQFDNISSNFRQNGWAYTHDDGQTWAFPGAIQPGVFNSDPVIDTDAQGNFYYLSYPSGSTIRLWRSGDGGVSWSGATSATGGDKPWMAVDKSGGIGDGHVYAIWQVGFGPRVFTRSTNGGQSFAQPVTVPQSPTFGTLIVDDAGVVYAAGRRGSSSSSFALARSTNARNPAQSPTFTTTVVNLGGSQTLSAGPNPGGLLGQAYVAADPTRKGHVYMLASVNPTGSDPMDVHFVRSVDNGQTFSSPVRVNDDTTNRWQWFGTMSCSPNGRIDVVWNDTRRSGAANMSETYYAYSLDAGVTWSKNVAVSPQWNSTIGHPSQNKIGDYYHMRSDAAAAHLAYSATFNGEQDLYWLRLGDCNQNQTHDSTDIRNGTSFDSNQNTIPDECETCQRDLGFGAGLALSLCGDPLTGEGSRATLDLTGGPAMSPVVVFLSGGQSQPPLALPAGGALVPDLAAVPALVFSGYVTNAQGQLGATWRGGPQNVTTLYAQAAMLVAGNVAISNALEVQIGTP